MLSIEQCEKILDIENIHFDKVLTVNCQLNSLEIPCKKLNIRLSESQKRLLACLLMKINSKREIINIVWYENHQCIRDNNYHQLVFQLRALLQRHQLSGKILITVPYYGLKLNEPLLKTIQSDAISEAAKHNAYSETPPAKYRGHWPSFCQWFLNTLR